MIITDLFESPQTCPECGGPSFSDLILAEKKDACYHKVKASAKVWPSAYASGRLVQCRKKGADNYGNSKNEGVAEAQLDEKCWDGYQQQGMKNKSGRQVPNCVPAESVNEMDKSQTPPGRDGSNDSDAGKKEYTAKPTTAKKVAKDGEKILNKELNKKQGVAEDQLDEKSTSQAQFRTMAAAAHNPEFAKKVGISRDVAKEFHGADRKQDYTDLPKKADEGKSAPKEKEADYGDDYQAMVARVKKLAGLGPLKTVYDPQKRVYRNVPTAVQPKK